MVKVFLDALTGHYFFVQVFLNQITDLTKFIGPTMWLSNLKCNFTDFQPFFSVFLSFLGSTEKMFNLFTV